VAEVEVANDEDLRPGDVVRMWCGDKTIVRIDRYDGPLREIIFAIAAYVPGAWRAKEGGFSLERGGQTERYVVPRS